MERDRLSNGGQRVAASWANVANCDGEIFNNKQEAVINYLLAFVNYQFYSTQTY